MWEFSSIAFVNAVAYMGPAVLFIYLGIVRWNEVMPGCRRLTIWLLAGLLTINQLRLAIYWIGQGFDVDLLQVVGSSEMVITINVALTIALLFVMDDKLYRKGT